MLESEYRYIQSDSDHRLSGCPVAVIDWTRSSEIYIHANTLT